ncbi:MAG: hypothetical protein SV377_02990 [Halobacteria archaeon]|nr:hypothetical protein [Halobacteria archaeon]
MPKCNHCGSEFDNEKPYLKHLKDEHPDELSRIERRKVEEELGDSKVSSSLLVYSAVAVVFGALFVGVMYFVFLGPGSNSQFSGGPYNLGAAHYHGSIVVSINGQQIDFSQPRFQQQDDFFHFEGGDGSTWHVHGQGVTLQYAMDTLGIHVTRNSVTIGNQTFRDSDESTTVRVLVNGQPVNPSSYVLQPDDSIRIIVETQSQGQGN